MSTQQIFVMLKHVKVIFCNLMKCIYRGICSLLGTTHLVTLVGLILSFISVYLTYSVQKTTNEIQKQIETPYEIVAKMELKNALMGTGKGECTMKDDWSETKERSVSVLEFRHHRHVLPLDWEMYRKVDFCIGGPVNVFGSDETKSNPDSA